jgi:hypothetical protein
MLVFEIDDLRLTLGDVVEFDHLEIKAFRIDLEDVRMGEFVAFEQRIERDTVHYRLFDILRDIGNVSLVFEEVIFVERSELLCPGCPRRSLLDRIENSRAVRIGEGRVDKSQTRLIFVGLTQALKGMLLRFEEHSTPILLLHEVVERIVTLAVERADLNHRNVIIMRVTVMRCYHLDAQAQLSFGMMQQRDRFILDPHAVLTRQATNSLLHCLIHNR